MERERERENANKETNKQILFTVYSYLCSRTTIKSGKQSENRGKNKELIFFDIACKRKERERIFPRKKHFGGNRCHALEKPDIFTACDA